MNNNDRQQMHRRYRAAALILWFAIWSAVPALAADSTKDTAPPPANAPAEDSTNAPAEHSANAPAEAPASQENGWNKAGQEVGDAAKAVGEASKETGAKVWEKTKEVGSDVAKGSEKAADATVEGSKSAWQKTKETTARWYNAAKQKVHEMTAPSPEK